MSAWKLGFVVAVVLVGTVSTGRADEIATITNDTDTNIELYLKWSHVPNESAKIVLAPGESIRQQAPPGKKLFMRFNSTPDVQGAPREIKLQVITANVPNGGGYTSTFKRSSPTIVVLTGE